MSKKLFENRTDTVTKYNGINVISKKTAQLSRVASENIVFSEFLNVVELNITESGFYKIEYKDNANKNLKIIVNEGLDVTIYEYNKSDNEVNINNVEVNVLKGSTLNYLALDEFKKSYFNRQMSVLEDAKLYIKLVSLNEGLNENKIAVDLNGKKALCDLKTVCVSYGENESHFDSIVRNNVGETYANIWQKGVCAKGGEINFIATGYIEKMASLAENFQESRILLLDEASVGNSSPLLLIEHHDVLAGHAASVSRVNEDELFYLQTRGLDVLSAEILMTNAFIAPLFDEISDEIIKNELLEHLNNRLNNVK